MSEQEQPKESLLAVPPLVRPAERRDLQMIRAIYGWHCLNSTGTFETDPPSIDDMRARFDKIDGLGWPWLVASPSSSPDRVLGFAYCGPFRDRAAYAQTVEDAVYVDPAWIRKGLGLALLTRLISAARVAGAHQMISLIGDSENHGSLGIHRQLGFQSVGVMQNVGRKFDRWLDVVIMQINLQA